MKTKNYLLAVAIGLFTTYSCDNGTDLAEDSSNKAKLGKVGIQDASIQEQALSTTLAQPPAGSYVNMVGKSSGRSSGTIYNAGYDVMNESQKTILKDVILARYTSTSGDSGGIVYALTKSTNTRYTVGINLGRIEVNGTIYGGCIKAYMINQTFGLTRY